MKNSKFIIVAVLVAISMFILPGCDKQLIEENQKADITETVSVITDPQIKADIDRLYKHNYIGLATYNKWNTEGIEPLIAPNGDVGYLDGDIIRSRHMIQSLSNVTGSNLKFVQ